MGPGFVFLSYARANAAEAQWLHDFLLQKGVRVWRDSNEIARGSWRAEIDRAISGADIIFLAVTPVSMASVEVMKEIATAADQRKTIVPVIFEATTFPDGVRNALAGLQVILAYGEHRHEAPRRISRALGQAGFVLNGDDDEASPISAALHQSAVRPAFDAKFQAGDVPRMLAEAEAVRRLAPSNLYAQLSVAALMMHSNADEAAFELCKSAAAQHSVNSDALHYLSIAELRRCSARRMTLGQVEAVERRAKLAFDLGGNQGQHLLPVGAVASDYRVRFGGTLPHGGPSQIAERIRLSAQNTSEVARFFSLVRTDFTV